MNRYASTCNAVGQTFGYFVAFTGFLGLKMYGIMDLAQFMRLWGYLFLLTTVALWLFKVFLEQDVPACAKLNHVDCA